MASTNITTELLVACAAGAAAATALGWWLQKEKEGAAACKPKPTIDTNGRLLEGRVMVVTGGASGIGREIALQAASQGCKVLVMDVTTTPLEGGESTAEAWATLKTSQTTGGGEVAFIRGDTTSFASCTAAVTQAVDTWGKLDVWVNNAAIGVGGTLLETTEEDWDKVMAVNAKGYFFGCKAAVTSMLTNNVDPDTGLRGRVINISSQHGMVACPGDLAYGVGKAAAVYMTRQLAVDYATHGIAVNAVAPGKIVTGCDSDTRPYSLARTPCPRLGRPADVASAVLFFASDMSSCFVTGVNLMVDGGWTAY